MLASECNHWYMSNTHSNPTGRFLAQAKAAPVNEARLAAYRASFPSETRRVLAATVPVPERFRTAVSK